MKKALTHFQKSDPILYDIAIKIDLPKWKKPDDPFVDLVESIINQQLSEKAAATIFERCKKLFPNEKITPEKLLKIKDSKIRECGVSRSKINYIKGIAKTIIDKKINLKSLETKNDEEVIIELTNLKGIGLWTAEMYLMFTLGRPDVFSAGDVGLQNAMKKLYKLQEINKKELILISSKWSPYRTTASRILWSSLGS